MNTQAITHWNEFQKAIDGILRPIKDDEHYEKVANLLDDLLEIHKEELSYIDFLIDSIANLLEKYDSENEICYSSPSEMLDFYMKERNINQTELSNKTKIDQSLISKHLRSEREISKENAKKYSHFFNVPLEIFHRL